MKAIEIVSALGTGLFFGFMMGIGSKSEREKLGIDSFAETLEKRGKKEDYGTVGLRKSLDIRATMSNLLGGIIFSSAYSLTNCLVNDYGAFDSLAPSFAGAYLGRLAGRFSGKLIGLPKNEMRTLEKMLDNPENALDYLPEKQRNDIEESLRDFEDRFIVNQDIKNKEVGESAKKVISSFMDDFKSYTPVVKKLIQERMKKIGHAAGFYSVIKEFYNNARANKIEIVGVPAKKRVRVFEISGNRLSTHYFKVSGFESISDDSEGFGEIRGSFEKVDSSTDIWEGDYKGMARNFANNFKEYTNILLYATPESSENEKDANILACFLRAHRSFQISKSKLN